MLRRYSLLPATAVILAACALSPEEPGATLSPQEPGATPALPPMPTLSPADDFASPGESYVPDGEYLFVEYFTVSDGVGDSCGGGMIDRPGYAYADGVLDPYGWTLDASSIGFAGYGQANQGAAGGGAASHLYPIQELPFAFPDGGPNVLAAYADGTIVAHIGSRTYLMRPGEAWVSHTDTTFLGCHSWSDTRFTNFGLLPREAIQGLE